MINCVIIEDEPQAVKTLRLMMADYFPDITVIGAFDRVSTAVPFILEHKPDFIFLDVQLNGEIGLDLVNYLTKDEINFEIIFTTAYSGYALDAFTLSAIDYLLKPINAERLKQAVARVLKRARVRVEQLQILQQVATTQTIERIVLKTHQGSHIVELKDIQFLKADNVYTEFHLTNGSQVVVSKPLKEYDILLTQPQFFKTHRSYIVNTAQIKRYHKTEGEIELKSGVKISVSRDKKKDFETYMGIS